VRIAHLLCLLVALAGCPESGTIPDDDDDGCEEVAAWLDLDGDGWGGEDVSSCTPPEGYVEQGGDCEDQNPARHPGAQEICNQLDDDCDGEVPPEEADADGDGYAGCYGDCDDDAPDVHPGAPEVCDGVDNDCQPTTDENADLDGDGASLCDGDCDDENLDIGPGEADVCDGLDNDCDGVTDPGLGMTVAVPGDCSGLQPALDAAPEGATVQLGPGLWYGPFRRQDASIHLVGTHGALATSLLADSEGAGLVLSDAGASSVSHVSFSDASDAGLVVEDCQLELASVRAIANPGVGIRVEGGTLVAHHIVVGANEGGGIAIWEAEAELSQVIAIGNETEGLGGGLYLESSEVSLSQAAVVGNVAAGGGGGIASVLSELEVIGSVIWANDASDGGGVYAEPPNDPDLTISWSNIQGNGPDDLDPDPGWPDAFVGGISVAPAFLGVDVSDDLPLLWDLHISASSANVDSGPPSSLDPDGSPADIGPYGGPGADEWDLDGDGWPLWWQPGPYSPGSYDCDDLNAAVYPGAGC